MTQAQAAAVFGRVTGTLTYDDFKRVDMVIEAAIEVRVAEYKRRWGGRGQARPAAAYARAVSIRIY